ncbi:MAG: hypothetical protein ABI444_00960 [Candidatus Kapaibacterium sp.]|jgi:hypothetical protein
MNMEQDDKRLQQVLDEIKRQDAPYSSPEPDPLYFANFRVRVMDQVDAKEHVKFGWLVRVRETLFGTALRGGLVGATMVAVLVGVFVLESTTEPTVQLAQNQTQHSAQTTPPVAIATPAPMKSNVSKPSAAVPNIQKDMAASDSAVKRLVKSPEFANRVKRAVDASEKDANEKIEVALNSSQIEGSISEPTVSTADGDEPVSLEGLSASDLQSVLSGLEQSAQ